MDFCMWDVKFPAMSPLEMRQGPGLTREPCPVLPSLSRPLRAASIHTVGEERGEAFYFLALECAQALWLAGRPAQALLLLNRALGADLSGHESVLQSWPLPYAAVRWLLEHSQEGDFMGNPRRHYQHLATRMVEPRRELRSWRAWACWLIARHVRPDDVADEKQLREEGVLEPSAEEIAAQLERLGLPGEVELWRTALVEVPDFRS